MFWSIVLCCYTGMAYTFLTERGGLAGCRLMICFFVSFDFDLWKWFVPPVVRGVWSSTVGTFCLRIQLLGAFASNVASSTFDTTWSLSTSCLVLLEVLAPTDGTAGLRFWFVVPLCRYLLSCVCYCCCLFWEVVQVEVVSRLFSIGLSKHAVNLWYFKSHIGQFVFDFLSIYLFRNAS